MLFVMKQASSYENWTAIAVVWLLIPNHLQMTLYNTFVCVFWWYSSVFYHISKSVIRYLKISRMLRIKAFLQSLSLLLFRKTKWSVKPLLSASHFNIILDQASPALLFCTITLSIAIHINKIICHFFVLIAKWLYYNQTTWNCSTLSVAETWLTILRFFRILKHFMTRGKRFSP